MYRAKISSISISSSNVLSSLLPESLKISSAFQSEKKQLPNEKNNNFEFKFVVSFLKLMSCKKEKKKRHTPNFKIAASSFLSKMFVRA
jgi:hypothetical protein